MKTAAQTDRLVKMSVSAYVADVLAPAMVHQLIMEDMGQNAEEALTTMYDSEQHGILYCDD